MNLLTLRPALSTLLCSFTLLFCTSGLAQDATPLTLSDLQDQASDAAINVLQSQQQLTAANLELSAFEASLKPRLDLVANMPNYYRTSREVVLDDGTIGFREIELNNSFVGLAASQQIATTNTSVTLESRLQRTDNLVTDDKSYQGSPIRLFVRQPLLAFNPLKWDRELLPLRRQVAERELTAARATARLEATNLFFDLVTADQERRIAELNQTANEQLYAVAEERFALGKINRGDLVQLRLELTSARQDLLRASRLVTSASAAIDRLLGKAEGSGNYSPVLPTTNQPTDIDATAARNYLQRNRPELLAAFVAEREAARQTDRTRRELGPRIDIEAGYGFIRNDAELAPIYNDPNDERILSVNLSLPILDWGERRDRVKAAQSNRELAREVARRTGVNLNSELEELLTTWTTVQEELALAEEIVALANERFEMSRASYELGAIPLTELSLAQQYRDRNTRAFAQTLRAYWLTYARLARLTLHDFINNRPL